MKGKREWVVICIIINVWGTRIEFQSERGIRKMRQKRNGREKDEKG